MVKHQRLAPSVQEARLNTIGATGGLILINLHVVGSEKPLRALLDTGATNNFIREKCLSELDVNVMEHPSVVVNLRLANGKSVVVPKRTVRLDYGFDSFTGKDVFLAIEMDEKFDCILGMPWLMRHRPEIDWLNRSITSLRTIDIDEVRSHLKKEPFTWLHVSVVDSSFDEQPLAAASDGPACISCHREMIQHSTSLCKTPTNRYSVLDDPLSAAEDLNATTSCSQRGGLTMAPPHKFIVPKVNKNVKRVANGNTMCVTRRSDTPTMGISSRSDTKMGHGVRATQANGPAHGLDRRNKSVAASDVRDVDADIWDVEAGIRNADDLDVNGAERISTSSEMINAIVYHRGGKASHTLQVENPPTEVEDIIGLKPMSAKAFLYDLKNGEIEQICAIAAAPVEPSASTTGVDKCEGTKVERFESQSWDALRETGNPVYELVMEFRDIFPEKIPEELPLDRGVRHEIDLAPGTKYCVTRQWPLPREQVDAIDKFFEGRRKAGHVRESKSPHSSPTFCVKKATGGWRIVHAFNKLNDATIPAQTPIPRKDMILDGMSGSTVFSAIDLTDGFYQILMREDDVPLTAVSTPSGMLWEWLVMPQGLKNAPATFNRMVSQLLRPFRSFAPSYFDDIFVHSSADGSRTDVEVHLEHLRKVFLVMRENKLYANLRKCMFCTPEIPVLGCYVGKDGVRADPEKVKSICAWPVPKSVKDLRQWLGLANYLHKYTANYAALVRPLSQLLKKESEWKWTPEHQEAFDAIKKSLQEAPVLALPDYGKPFHVVCDASQFAIGCALMQHDSNGHERVISYQSRQLKTAERNYPVHDKELLAMKYSLVKFRVYLLGEQRFVIYTDHASLRTATNSPHLSQRMARWLSFFAEYNFVVFYKPGKLNILADALSRRPDYDPRCEEDLSVIECVACPSEALNSVAVRATSSLRDDIIASYENDAFCAPILHYLQDPSESALRKLPNGIRARIPRYSLADGLLYYSVDVHDPPRVVVPTDDDIRSRLMHEYHDSPMGGHLGREKTFLALSRDYYWNHQYKWVRKWVRSCDTCQRIKPTASSQAPLRPLPIPTDCWKSISMDFIFGLPPDARQRDGVVVFVDRFSKMAHMAPVSQNITAEETALLFIDVVFRHHGLPETIVSDRDPRFTALFWRSVFKLLDTSLDMSTAAHPETDGQTERVNRVLEDVLRSFATSFPDWSTFLPLAEFAMNNSVHTSTGMTPFYVNSGRHPRVPALLGMTSASRLSGGEAQQNSVLSELHNGVTPSTVETVPVTPSVTATGRRRSKRLQQQRCDASGIDASPQRRVHFNPRIEYCSGNTKGVINNTPQDDHVKEGMNGFIPNEDSKSRSGDRQRGAKGYAPNDQMKNRSGDKVNGVNGITPDVEMKYCRGSTQEGMNKIIPCEPMKSRSGDMCNGVGDHATPSDLNEYRSGDTRDGMNGIIPNGNGTNRVVPNDDEKYCSGNTRDGMNGIIPNGHGADRVAPNDENGYREVDIRSGMNEIIPIEKQKCRKNDTGRGVFNHTPSYGLSDHYDVKDGVSTIATPRERKQYCDGNTPLGVNQVTPIDNPSVNHGVHGNSRGIEHSNGMQIDAGPSYSRRGHRSSDKGTTTGYGMTRSMPCVANGIATSDEDESVDEVSSETPSSDAMNAVTMDANFDVAPSIETLSKKDKESINDFILKRQSMLRFVRDAIASALDVQKEQADKRGRKNVDSYEIGDQVLLSTSNLPTTSVTNLGAAKLQPIHRSIPSVATIWGCTGGGQLSGLIGRMRSRRS